MSVRRFKKHYLREVGEFFSKQADALHARAQC